MPSAGPEPAALLAIGVGGAVGSLGRYAVGLSIPHDAGALPWATFVVNVSGAFAMGLLVAFLVDRPGIHRLVRPFLGVGVLGGWTTFSALAVDAVGLTSGGHPQAALLYVAGTFVVGVLAVAGGAAAGQKIWPGP